MIPQMCLKNLKLGNKIIEKLILLCLKEIILLKETLVKHLLKESKKIVITIIKKTVKQYAPHLHKKEAFKVFHIGRIIRIKDSNSMI